MFNSPDEHFRIRYVNIIYFLEDDTISVIEPPVDNAGFLQGKLVSRGKIAKNVKGDTLYWKDLNVGIDVCTFNEYLCCDSACFLISRRLVSYYKIQKLIHGRIYVSCIK